MSFYLISKCLRNDIMLKGSINRYKNYILNLQPLRNTLPSINCTLKMRYYYKHILVKSLYLKRQRINLYKHIVCKNLQNFFLQNAPVLKKFFEKDRKRTFFSWADYRQFFKNKQSKNQYQDFYNLLLLTLPKISFIDFRYYWLSVFFSPSIKTRFYYFTNKIKFFSNQRLIKQPVLLLYNTTNKNNLYSNYMRFFKGFVIKKDFNSLFLFKSVIFQLYPKFNKKSYFFRHNNYIRKFTTSTHLKLLPT